jgi:hypothetical protein
VLVEYKIVSQSWIQFRPYFLALKKFKSSSNRWEFKNIKILFSVKRMSYIARNLILFCDYIETTLFHIAAYVNGGDA